MSGYTIIDGTYQFSEIISLRAKRAFFGKNDCRVHVDSDFHWRVLLNIPHIAEIIATDKDFPHSASSLLH